LLTQSASNNDYFWENEMKKTLTLLSLFMLNQLAMAATPIDLSHQSVNLLLSKTMDENKA
jgi:hypothetical protein